MANQTDQLTEIVHMEVMITEYLIKLRKIRKQLEIQRPRLRSIDGGGQ